MFIIIGAVFKILNIKQDKKIAALLTERAEAVHMAEAEETLATITHLKQAA